MGGLGGTGVALGTLGVGGAPPSMGRLEGPGFAGRARPEAVAAAAPGSGAALDVSAGSAGAEAEAEGLFSLAFGKVAAASGGSSVVRAKKTPTITAAKPSIATMPIAMPMATPLPLLEGVPAAGTGTG